MGFKIKNSLTGEFEKLPILTLKGEKGETGGVEEYNKVDYMGNKYETLKQANDANVEYAVKTAIGEFNYLDYEGQHITATDTIEGRAKSAILTGQTLVNLVGEKRFYTNNGAGTPLRGWEFMLPYNLTSGKTYLAIFDVTGTIDESNSKVYLMDNKFSSTTGNTEYPVDFKVGYNMVKCVASGDNHRVLRIRTKVGTSVDFEVSNVMLIEYQDGMENWDIPYFEGMQSVKLPVLRTVGKNLYNSKNSYVSGAFNQDIDNEMNVEPNTTYTFYANGKNWITVDLFNKENVNTRRVGGTSSTKSITFTTTNEEVSVMLKYLNGDNTIIENVDFTGVQLEKGSTATTYEPFKSNILSTPEEVVLRGFDSMKDTLNLNTGEYAKRIGELTLNGSEYWQYENNTDGTTRFNLPISDFKNYDTSSNGKNLINDKLPKTYFSITGNTYGVTTWCNHVVFFTEHTNVNDFKQWLSQNPTTIQYELATPVIKTVALSDHHVYSYKDVTHYDCSSAEGSLVPTLSVKVPTDVQATIAQQRETIQTLNSENERLNQIQEALKASMLDSQVQLMNLSWDIDFEVFTLRESIAPKDFLLDSRTGSNIDKFSQAKFIIENDCPDLEKLNSQIEYYFSKDVFSQEQFEELTYLISIVKGENSCEY